MFNRFNTERLFCGLDVGSQRIKASLVRLRDGQAAQLVDIFEQKTSGFKDASVSDLAELTDSIHAVMNGLFKKTQTRVKQVSLGLGGDLIAVRRNDSTIPLVERGSKVITSFDLRKVNTQARLLGVKMDEEIVHDVPQIYRVDDVNVAANPLGLSGRKLEVETMLIVANGTRLHNVVKAVNQAGFEVSDICYTSYAAAEAILSDEDKANGCIMLDVGSRVTSILIYCEGVLKYLTNIPWGGYDVTRRIAQDLNLSQDLAEDIKKSYAVAVLSDKRNEEEILVKRDSAFTPVKREDICRSIDPEVVYLVQFINDSIRASGISGRINAGVYLIGGGSLLPGLMERIEEATQLPVSMGKVRSMNNTWHAAAVYASSIGAAQLSAQEAAKTITFSNTFRSGDVSVVTRIKELYHEYF